MASTSNHHSLSKSSELVDMNDWMRTEEKKGAGQEARGLAKEGGTENPERAPDGISGTPAIVTGRPTSSSPAGPKTKGTIRQPKTPIEIDLGGKNWTGLLLEYRNAHPIESGPAYQESSPAINSFTCSVSIGECPSPFGIPGPIFTKKKDAKHYASKLAIEWLIAHSHMPADGSVSFPKIHSPPVAPAAGAGGAAADDGTAESSPGQKVAEMCIKLGIPPPTYDITPHKEFPSMYSGFAHFGGHLLGHGKIGEFENVYGRGNAKAECARKVLVFLQGVKRAREEGARPRLEERGEGTAGVENQPLVDVGVKG